MVRTLPYKYLRANVYAVVDNLAEFVFVITCLHSCNDVVKFIMNFMDLSKSY